MQVPFFEWEELSSTEDKHRCAPLSRSFSLLSLSPSLSGSLPPSFSLHLSPSLSLSPPPRSLSLAHSLALSLALSLSRSRPPSIHLSRSLALSHCTYSTHRFTPYTELSSTKDKHRHAPELSSQRFREKHLLK